MAATKQRVGEATGSPTGAPSGAAFFDLDRTLLRGASGEVFSDAMRSAGLVSRTIPGERYIYGLFNTVGETLPSMALARQAVNFAKGHSRASVQEAADSVADRLVGMVQPFARSVFEMHRAEGRPLVLATTTPYDLVKPFADRLELDDVIATRYGLEDDGDTYDGTLAGPFVWSAGKLEAVREWAEAHDVDLAASWFYSDSVYDTPLMSVIGNPVVVNPDPRMMLMAAARRWPTLNLDVSPGVAKVPLVGLELQRLAMAYHSPVAGAMGRHSDLGHGQDPSRRSGDPRRQPPLVLRCHGDGDGRRQDRTHRPIPGQEGGVRHPVSWARSPRRWAGSASTVGPGRRSPSRRPSKRSRVASWSCSCRRARSRAGRRSSTPS